MFHIFIFKWGLLDRVFNSYSNWRLFGGWVASDGDCAWRDGGT